MSRSLISASMSDITNEDTLRAFKKNSDVSAQYKDYLQIQNLIEAGYSFCEFMKTYNYGDIKATGMSDIDCDSNPPNWKFKDRLVQPYWDTWATCWNGLKSRIKPDLNVDPFTATEHRLHNEQKKDKDRENARKSSSSPEKVGWRARAHKRLRLQRLSSRRSDGTQRWRARFPGISRRRHRRLRAADSRFG
mmetsp:Transcript_78188/g.123418  ORF Transcript_78188/g.123418 Transcript_78188/m.123418 type:complete len:191 (-) Transcript_78188:59-631(-)